MAALQLHVVDRHTEVERLVRTAEYNGSLESDRKIVLMYSSQAFGSGKTMFGINAISLIKDSAVAQALIDPPTDAPNIPHDLINMRRNQEFTQEKVDSYINAKTVYVDLSLGLEKSPVRVEKRMTFEEALYHAIYSAATYTKIAITDLDSKIGTYSADNLMSLLVKETGHTGKWFLFIDEIGHMEVLERHYDEIKSKPIVVAYTALFTLLRPFLTRNDTFAFCAGKSAHLTAKSLEESTSPVLLRLLAMSPLLPQHIVEVLRKTKYPTNKPLYLALGLPDDDEILLLLAKVLYHYTGGIPRLVLAALESLLSNSPVPLTSDGMEQVMKEKVRGDIVVDTSCFFRPEYIDADAARVYATLLLMSVLGITIRKEWVIGIGHASSTKFVLDWVSNLCLHLAPAGPDTYTLVFSQFLIDWLQQFPPDDEPQIVLLASLLDQLKSLPAIIDQGRILEVIIAQALALRLAVAKTFGDIPGLEDTLLRDVAVRRDLGGRFDIHFLPSFQNKTTSGTPKVADGVVKSYNPDDWHLFFQNLGTNTWNTVGIARKQNSNGPDLMVPFQVTPLVDHAQLPASFYHLGIAAKNLQAKTATNWNDVQEEIEEGLTKPLTNKHLTGKLKIVLVIASTHLIDEIANAINPRPCGVFDAGNWYFNKSRKELEKKGGKELKGWSLKFTVPKGGQLVILSNKGLGMLLGNKIISSLADYYDAECVKSKWTNLLLVEHSFGILAHTTTERKRKREDDDTRSSDASRMLKIEFVEDGSKNAIGKPAAAILPTGTTLNDAKNIISSAFLDQNPSMREHTVVGIEWFGVSVDDKVLDGIRHAETVVTVMQENK